MKLNTLESPNPPDEILDIESLDDEGTAEECVFVLAGGVESVTEEAVSTIHFAYFGLTPSVVAVAAELA
jgi:hypothetical protein